MKKYVKLSVGFMALIALPTEGLSYRSFSNDPIELQIQADGPVEHPDMNTTASNVICANYHLTVVTSVRAGEFYLTELSVNGNKMDPQSLDLASSKIRSSGEFAYFGVRCYRNMSISVVFFPYVPPGLQEPEDIYVAEYSEREGFWRPRE